MGTDRADGKMELSGNRERERQWKEESQAGSRRAKTGPSTQSQDLGVKVEPGWRPTKESAGLWQSGEPAPTFERPLQPLKPHFRWVPLLPTTTQCEYLQILSYLVAVALDQNGFHGEERLTCKL